MKSANRILSPSEWTEEQKELVWRMFFGPYKEEWRDANGIVDNKDTTIAERTGLSYKSVLNYIAMRLKDHMCEVNGIDNPFKGQYRSVLKFNE